MSKFVSNALVYVLLEKGYFQYAVQAIGTPLYSITRISTIPVPSPTGHNKEEQTEDSTPTRVLAKLY